VNALVTVGRVVRPQGRHGELIAEPLSDRPDRFPTLKTVLVASASGTPREMAVERCWAHKGRFVLKLAGVDSIEAAERLRGCELAIAESELQPLPPGSYYHHQLRGLQVRDRAGRQLGTVRDVLETGGVCVLEVARPGGELLIPLAEPFVVSVDLAAGALTAIVPEELGAA
jgi:16S rRNA processing protein RimM